MICYYALIDKEERKKYLKDTDKSRNMSKIKILPKQIQKVFYVEGHEDTVVCATFVV